MSDVTPERWREIEAVLDRVLDAPESERQAVLDRETAGDPELRRRVERLLSSSELAGSKFDAPPLLVARDAIRGATGEERDYVEPGDLIGTWRISALLGRGGMGAVYEAERADGAFEKKVALKIVKRGMDTDEILRRFRHERRILARLEHPNIAGLIDGGVTPGGLPYFVMELAHGERIDRWCDQHGMPIRERLRLFVRVCDAVQYAHTNLIVHRDIKPGNIVVSGEDVKLLDFGIAKLVGGEEGTAAITQAHAARLTPQYAAPEQIRGQATTTATDVYSLGVVLYELLCGRLPYRLSGRTLLEMEQIVCNVDPLMPSVAVTRIRDGEQAAKIARQRGASRTQALQQQLRGDLDAICLKALGKQAEDRYVSAAALAEDILRHLQGRPVRAHPPSRGYQLRKFVRRNLAMVSLGTATAVILVAASITTTVLGRNAAEQRDLRQVEAERATAARDFVIGTLGSFDPDEMPGQLTFSARDLVRRGRDNLNALDVQPPLKATVMNTLGQVAFNLGERAVADSLFREAHDILLANGGGPDLAVSMMGIAQVLQRDGRYVEAAEWYAKALDVRQATLGPESQPAAESRRALAFANYNQDETEADAEAERLYTELLELPDSMRDVRVGALEGLADLRLRRGRYDEAESLYEQVLDARRRSQPADHPDIARTRWGLAYVRMGQGRLAEAEQIYREALGSLERTYGPQHRDVAFGYIFLGNALRTQDRTDEAARAFLKAAEISENVNAPGHNSTGDSWYRYGEAELAKGRAGEAERALRRARETYWTGARARGDSLTEPQGIMKADLLLARALEAQQREQEAMPLLREAFRLAPDSANAAVAAARLAELFDRLGRADSAAFYRSRVGG